MRRHYCSRSAVFRSGASSAGGGVRSLSMAAKWAQAARAAMFHPEHGWKTTHFWGPVANWGIVGAAVYDITKQGPDVVSVPMTGTLAVYSAIFMRFAWAVTPRNYLLFSCHAFNEAVQLTQLARGYAWQREHQPELARQSEELAVKAGAAAAGVVVGGVALRAPLAAALRSEAVPASVRNAITHPAGPLTVHFWAPTWKWMLSVSNIMDYKRPVEKVSGPQQVALGATGIIWTRYSMVITPVNYNLAAVNATLACTAGYHVARKAGLIDIK